jgi:Arc/MetJ-type ribon-helix-helix transcriptional regulator
VERGSYSLHGDHVEPGVGSRIQEELKSGQFASAEQLIKYALCEIERQRRIINSIPAAELEVLLQEAEADIAAGRVYTPEEVRAHLNEVKAELRRADRDETSRLS